MKIQIEGSEQEVNKLLKQIRLNRKLVKTVLKDTENSEKPVKKEEKPAKK